MASNFYRGSSSPRFFLGHGLELGFIVLGIIAASILIVSYARMNKSRERRMANGDADNYTPEELSFKGDRAITFRYMY